MKLEYNYKKFHKILSTVLICTGSLAVVLNLILRDIFSLVLMSFVTFLGIMQRKQYKNPYVRIDDDLVTAQITPFKTVHFNIADIASLEQRKKSFFIYLQNNTKHRLHLGFLEEADQGRLMDDLSTLVAGEIPKVDYNLSDHLTE